MNNTTISTTETKTGANFISTNGYENCVELSNNNTRVVLEPNCGGRILNYELNGKNILYVDPRHDGWIWDGDNCNEFPYYGGPCGGRFDIGPENGIPQHPLLFLGKWDIEIIGTRHARLISQKDDCTGLQLKRDIILDDDSSKLIYTQVIINISDEEKKYYHWSRTFANGNGICLVPTAKYSRFPLKYLSYGPGNILDYDPEPEDAIRVVDNILEINSTPTKPKIAIDTDSGWIAYLAENSLLFTKSFPIFKHKWYGDLAANPVSIWYYKNQVVEIEPTSPFETIPVGGEYSFTEVWNLTEFDFPKDRKLNYNKVIQELNNQNIYKNYDTNHN